MITGLEVIDFMYKDLAEYSEYDEYIDERVSTSIFRTVDSSASTTRGCLLGHSGKRARIFQTVWPLACRIASLSCKKYSLHVKVSGLLFENPFFVVLKL